MEKPPYAKGKRKIRTGALTQSVLLEEERSKCGSNYREGVKVKGFLPLLLLVPIRHSVHHPLPMCIFNRRASD